MVFYVFLGFYNNLGMWHSLRSLNSMKRIFSVHQQDFNVKTTFISDNITCLFLYEYVSTLVRDFQANLQAMKT